MRREHFFILAITVAGVGLVILQCVTVPFTSPFRRTAFHHTGQVCGGVLSQDCNTLVAWTREDRTIRLWDVATGAERAIANWVGDSGMPAFSPDGKTLAGGDKDGVIRLWDVATGDEQAILRGHTGPVAVLAFSPDGKTLASGGDDNMVQLWNLATGKVWATLRQEVGPEREIDRICSLAFTPDGKTLAAGTYGAVKLWDTATNELRGTLQGLGSFVTKLAISPDGKTLAAADVSDGRSMLWDMTTLKQRPFQPPAWMDEYDCYVRGLAFSADGKTLALTTFHAVGLWDVASGTNTAAFGRGTRTPLYMSIWSVLDSLREEPGDEYFSSVAFTPAGKVVVLAIDGRWVRTFELPGVRVRK